MKEFHILSTGVSLLTNAQKHGIFPNNIRPSDEPYWGAQMNNPKAIQALYEFLQNDPRKYSAELNTFYRAVEGKNPKEIEVYLVGTKTAANELVRRVLEQELAEKGYRMFLPYEAAGYFNEICYFDPSQTAEVFVRAFGGLLDRLLALGMKKKKEGYRVLYNPTGGFKAHVILCALAGFLTGSEVYYMNEDFQALIYFPHLFYLPRGRELELLRILSQNSNQEPHIIKALLYDYSDEIDRLSLYQLIDLEENNAGGTDIAPMIQIRLRPIARLFLADGKNSS